MGNNGRAIDRTNSETVVCHFPLLELKLKLEIRTRIEMKHKLLRSKEKKNKLNLRQN